MATHSSNLVIKFADDTTVIGLITNGDESAYRSEVENLVEWCQANNLTLNVDKTKEMVIRYRQGGGQHDPIHIKGVAVERVTSYKFLGVHITEKLDWDVRTGQVVKKAQTAPLPPQKAEKVWHGVTHPESLYILSASTEAPPRVC